MAHLLANPRLKFYDSAGAALAAGKIYTYAAGTTTPLASYTDKTEGAANANPVVLDAYGEADIWLSSYAYKIVIKTSADVTIRTYDNVTQVNADTITTAKINDLAVTTAKINDLAVTAAKIDALTITAAKLAADAVTTSKITDLNVTTAKINDLGVTTGKLAANAVTAAKIDADFVNDFTTATPESVDYLLFGDTSDSNNAKKALISDLPENTTKRLMSYYKNQGASTATNLGFPAAPTLKATVSAIDNVNGTYLRHTTGAVIGNSSGVISTTFTVVQPRWLPEFLIKMASGQNVSAISRGFVGFFSASPDAAGDVAELSSTPATAFAAFVYERPAVSAPAYLDTWVAITSNGTAGAGNYTRTECLIAGAKISPNTACTLRIAFVSSSDVRFYINGTLYATHTTTLPTSNQALGFGARIVTAEALATDIEWSRIEVRHL